MSYESLAYIVDGATNLSEEVRISTVQPDGTTIKLYDSLLNLLGTATVAGSIAIVHTSRPLILGEAIVAFVGDLGEKSGGPAVVLDSQLRPTGWRIPTIVRIGEENLTTLEYEELTGLTLPVLYDPFNSNSVPQITEADLAPLNPSEPSEPSIPPIVITPLQQIGFDVTVVQSGGAVTVTVSNIRGVTSPLIRFDSGSFGSGLSKTYSANTTSNIRVADPENMDRYLDRAVAVAIVATPTSAIWAVGYILYKGGTTILRANAYCQNTLQVRCMGILNTWTDCVTNGNYEWHSDIGNGAGTVVPGTFTLEFRVKTSTSDTISVPCIVTP